MITVKHENSFSQLKSFLIMASALTSSSSTSNGVSDRIDIFCSLDNTEIGILDDADNICTKLRIHFNLNVKVVQIVPGSRLYTDKDVREAMDKSKLVLIFGTKHYGGNENENVTSFGTKEQLEIIALRKLPYYIIKMCNNFKYTRVRELFDGLGPFTQWNCRGSARSEWNRSDPLPEDMIGNIAQAYMSASRYRLEKTNPHAIVKKIYTNGIYEGQIEHEQRNGRGSFLFNTTPGELRQRYEGEWLYDMITGHGVQTYIDGSRYEGDFESNLRSGHGVCVDSDGNNYNGCYKRDQKCGYGRFSWKNGSLYEGYWRNDVRHGSGTFSWPSGDMYTGRYYAMLLYLCAILYYIIYTT